MKRLLIIAAHFIAGAIPSQNNDSVRFVYVLQNPKFFGIDNAKSWFEIEGMKDVKLQAQINDSLRKVFFEKTELETGEGHATLRNDEKTPVGFTDYFFFNGQTYGNGWVRFKDSDSLLRITKADGYYGSGKNLGGFSQEIAQGKIAWIGIYASRFGEDGSFDDRSIELAFDLRTGKSIPTNFIVRINPVKRDSLERILKAKAYKEINRDDGSTTGSITGLHALSDTVNVNMAQLIRWNNAAKGNYTIAISRYYDADVISNGNHYQWKPMAFLTFDEAIPFLLDEDWLALQKMF